MITGQYPEVLGVLLSIYLLICSLLQYIDFMLSFL